MIRAEVELGEVAPGFNDLLGVDGRSYSTSSFLDKQLLVLVFFGNGCPTCKAAEERLIGIQRDYVKKNVQVILVNSNNSSLSPPDTLDAMKRRALDVGYIFPYIKDEDRKLARSLGAITTPHAFIIDQNRRLRYKGRIDNARQKSRVTVNDLQNAIDDLLASGIVKNPETDPFGCGIVW